MTDLIAAGGLVLVIAGLLRAAAPGLGRRLLRAAAMLQAQLPIPRAVTMPAGVSVVWFVRG